MKFTDFIKEGKVRKASVDWQLAKSIIKTSESDLTYLNKCEIDEHSAQKIMTNYYEVLRSLLEAMAVIKGYKVYSHEAFTYFLKEVNEDQIAHKFDRFRKIRNGINYYGESISVEEAEEYVEDIKKLINKIKEKYLRELK